MFSNQPQLQHVPSIYYPPQPEQQHLSNIHRARVRGKPISDLVVSNIIRTRNVNAILALEQQGDDAIGPVFKKLAISYGRVDAWSLIDLVKRLLPTNKNVLDIALEQAVKSRSLQLVNDVLELGSINPKVISYHVWYLLSTLPDTSYDLKPSPDEDTYEIAWYLIDAMLKNGLASVNEIVSTLKSLSRDRQEGEAWELMNQIIINLIQSINGADSL